MAIVEVRSGATVSVGATPLKVQVEVSEPAGGPLPSTAELAGPGGESIHGSKLPGGGAQVLVGDPNLTDWSIVVRHPGPAGATFASSSVARLVVVAAATGDAYHFAPIPVGEEASAVVLRVTGAPGKPGHRTLTLASAAPSARSPRPTRPHDDGEVAIVEPAPPPSDLSLASLLVVIDCSASMAGPIGSGHVGRVLGDLGNIARDTGTRVGTVALVSGSLGATVLEPDAASLGELELPTTFGTGFALTSMRQVLASTAEPTTVVVITDDVPPDAGAGPTSLVDGPDGHGHQLCFVLVDEPRPVRSADDDRWRRVVVPDAGPDASTRRVRGELADLLVDACNRSDANRPDEVV